MRGEMKVAISLRLRQGPAPPYPQCDTHATMSPNCRDSVAWVSFRGRYCVAVLSFVAHGGALN